MREKIAATSPPAARRMYFNMITSLSICCRALDAVDDDDLQRACRRLELEAKLLLQCDEQGRPVRIDWRHAWRRRGRRHHYGRPPQAEREPAGQPRLVDDELSLVAPPSASVSHDEGQHRGKLRHLDPARSDAGGPAHRATWRRLAWLPRWLWSPRSRRGHEGIAIRG